MLLREVDPEPIFAELPALFEAICNQSADAFWERLSGTEGRLTWAAWFDVWLEHFGSWNDPMRLLAEQHCVGPDAKQLAQMLASLDGADLVYGGGEHRSEAPQLWWLP